MPLKASPLTSLQPLGPHYPHCTSPASTIIDSNVNLAVGPHQRNCYMHTPKFACTQINTDKTHKNKQWMRHWFALNYSCHDACACQSKGTHSEDKRYGPGSELDSLIISSDLLYHRLWELESRRGNREKTTNSKPKRKKNRWMFFSIFLTRKAVFVLLLFWRHDKLLCVFTPQMPGNQNFKAQSVFFLYELTHISVFMHLNMHVLCMHVCV